ncbi:MAG TPA: hypothetical protein VLV87_08270 [Gammaproteobacteria bacterium]|nr:hypothetical protein [Gammaproteobacteria bacterium]
MRYGLVMAALLGAIGLAGCSGSGETYALRGTPTARSGTNSGNFLISGKDCKYVTMIGFYAADAPVISYPCQVTADEEDALGDKHTHVTIDITTPKGKVTAKIDGTQAGMSATTAPDLGNNYPFPPAWAVAAPAPEMTLVSNDANSTSKVVIKVSGVECAVTINGAAQNCGLSYWSDGSIAIWIPATLVNADYASYLWNLNLGKTAPGQWSLARPPTGFPATYGEVASK